MKLLIFLLISVFCWGAENAPSNIYEEMRSISTAITQEVVKTKDEIKAEKFPTDIEQAANQSVSKIQSKFLKQLNDLETKFKRLEDNDAGIDYSVLTQLAQQYLSDAKQILISTEESLIGEEVQSWWKNFGDQMKQTYQDKYENDTNKNNNNNDNQVNSPNQKNNDDTTNMKTNKKTATKSRHAKKKHHDYPESDSGTEVSYMQKKFKGDHGSTERRYEEWIKKYKNKYAAASTAQDTELQIQEQQLNNLKAQLEMRAKQTENYAQPPTENGSTKYNYFADATGVQFNTVEESPVAEDELAMPFEDEPYSFLKLFSLVSVVTVVLGSCVYYLTRSKPRTHYSDVPESELTTLLEGKSHYQSSV